MTSSPLPDLVTGRQDHACGSYTVAGEMVGWCSPYLVVTLSQVLLVAGGADGYGEEYQYLSSTEVISYPEGRAWREVGHLPSPNYGPRGASLDGILYLTGGTIGSSGTDGNNIYNFFFHQKPRRERP